VFVFLTPTVLYRDPDELSERRYDDYVEFESFRKQLTRHPQVTAFEIAPKTRLETVLATGRSAYNDATNEQHV